MASTGSTGGAYTTLSNVVTVGNSANTLSLFSSPGQDARLFNTNSNSIFTFGDFRIYNNASTNPITSSTQTISFGGFDTLETLGTNVFTPPQPYSVNYNELNLPNEDPFSYSYFGSFYTEVSTSINNIITSYPYALLSYTNYSAITIYDYSTTYNNITGDKTATFKIPLTSIINQGNVIINSGSTITGVPSLVNNYTGYSIQMSAMTSAATNIISITTYIFSGGPGAYLQFTINDFLEGVSGSTSYLPVYIRPSAQNLAQYNLGLSKSIV